MQVLLTGRHLSFHLLDQIRTSWYKPEQTPGSVLGEVSSSMEECRAETVALFREYTNILQIIDTLIYVSDSRR
jgi:hypothetical protein